MNEQVTKDADSALACEISPTREEQPREETAEATAFSGAAFSFSACCSFCPSVVAGRNSAKTWKGSADAILPSRLSLAPFQPLQPLQPFQPMNSSPTFSRRARGVACAALAAMLAAFCAGCRTGEPFVLTR